MRPFLLLIIISLLSSFAFAQKVEQRPLITVSGQAEMNVTPDRAVLSLRVVTLDKDINKSKDLNDDRVKKTLALAKKFDIKPENIQTSYISIDEDYSDSTTTRPAVFQGYRVTKRISITLTDLKRLEDLLSEIIKAGVNRVDGLSFETSQLRRYKDQARAMAMRAAKEKATAMAGEIGQDIGKAFSIDEEVEQRDYTSNNFSVNGRGSMPGDYSDSGGTIAIGQIKVTARVTVSFELK